MTYAFITTDATFEFNGVVRKRLLEESGKPILNLYDTFFHLRLVSPLEDVDIFEKDTITINGTTITGSLSSKYNNVRYNVVFNENPVGGTPSNDLVVKLIDPTSYNIQNGYLLQDAVIIPSSDATVSMTDLEPTLVTTDGEVIIVGMLGPKTITFSGLPSETAIYLVLKKIF